MTKFLSLALNTIAVCAAAVGPSQTENSVVQVAVAIPAGGQLNFTNLGTGFFVREDGVIVTASHVYLKAMSAIVDARAGFLVARRFSKTEPRTKWVATTVDLVAQDYSHDIVLLKMRSVDAQWKDVGGLTPLILEDLSATEDGATVGMRGYFGTDNFPLFLEGKVAGSTELGPLAVQELLIVLPVAPGHSGSPLVSMETGRVLGVITAIVPVSLPFNQQPAHSGLARAVKAEHVKRLVDSLSK